MSSDILQCWISSEVEFTSVMTDFPSSAIERICGALNRLVSDVIINWHVQHARPKMSLISSALPNVLLVMVCCWVVGIVKTLKKWCYGTWGNNQYRNLLAEVYFEAARFCIARDQRQYWKCAVMHRAVGARTMHSFGTDLVRNPAIWLVESRD